MTRHRCRWWWRDLAVDITVLAAVALLVWAVWP